AERFVMEGEGEGGLGAVARLAEAAHRLFVAAELQPGGAGEEPVAFLLGGALPAAGGVLQQAHLLPAGGGLGPGLAALEEPQLADPGLAWQAQPVVEEERFLQPAQPFEQRRLAGGIAEAAPEVEGAAPVLLLLAGLGEGFQLPL